MDQLCDTLPPQGTPIDTVDEISVPRWHRTASSYEDPEARRRASMAQPASHFGAFLQRREMWEAALFRHCQYQGDNIKGLKELLETDAELTLMEASDGGAKAGKGSFGWILKSGTEIFWTCRGPALGTSPTSFRCEGYDLLSFSTFLVLYMEYFQVTRPHLKGLQLFCDNKGLVIHPHQPTHGMGHSISQRMPGG